MVQDATEALESENVLVKKDSCGNLTGALALWLALKHPRENIHALLLLSPNLGIRTPRGSCFGTLGKHLAARQQENRSSSKP